MHLDPESILSIMLLGSGGFGRSFSELGLLIVAVVMYYVPRKWFRVMLDALELQTSGVCTRIITHRRFKTRWGMREDSHNINNELLQKALIRKINFQQKHHWPLCQTSFISYLQRNEDGESYRSSPCTYFNTFRVVDTPPLDRWVCLSNKVMFKRTIESNGSSEHPEESETYYLRGKPDFVNEYLDDAVALYKKLLSTGDDGKRYIYMPMRQRQRDDLVYKRYALDDGRTFSTLHMPQKHRVINLLDTFMKGEGKFSVPGFPSKLGFLLYGPPGTGKTTFVKALAQYTGRHIIEVSLEKIRTNQELVSVFNDKQFYVSEEDGGRNDLAYTDVIFLMEDIDAACRIVSKRAHATKKADSPSDSVSALKQLLETHLETNDNTKPQVESDDAVNLAGLLNVLDGTLDSPGRIVVMTTNHVDALDPALIRPGRINMQIHMSFILPDDAFNMLLRYFGEDACLATDPRLQFFYSAHVTPAALEAMCGYHDSVDDLFDSLLN